MDVELLAGIFATANGSEKRSNTRKTGRRGGSGRGKATQNVHNNEGNNSEECLEWFGNEKNRTE